MPAEPIIIPVSPGLRAFLAEQPAARLEAWQALGLALDPDTEEDPFAVLPLPAARALLCWAEAHGCLLPALAAQLAQN
jgi:hypothetical protein